MINAVSPVVSTPKALAPQKVNAQSAKVGNLKKDNRTIDEKQNDNLLLELSYIGSQLKTLLDLQAGKEVNVKQFANKLPEDAIKTPVQKQKDDAIVELGYIGDVLKKMVDVKTGKLEEEKPRKTADRI